MYKRAMHIISRINAGVKIRMQYKNAKNIKIKCNKQLYSSLLRRVH